MLGALGCLVAIAFMVVVIFKGLHPLIAALIASLIAILANGADIWKSLLDGFGGGMTGFIKSYVLMFFLGAALGEFMSRSEYAKAIAYKMVDLFGSKRGILVVLVATAILTYSGVSVFVVIFTVYPIALYVFQQGDIPRRLIPAVVNLGAGVFTMTMLPGSPALTNVIPTTYCGTNIYAAPVLGCILAVIAALLGYSYLVWDAKKMQKNGEHFAPGRNDVVEPISIEARAGLPNFFIAFVPVIIIFVGNLVFARMGLNSTFGVCISLLLGILYIILTSWNKLTGKSRMEGLNKGATSALFAITNTAAIVGFAGVVKVLPAFTSFTNIATNMPFPPIVSATLSMDLIAGITASSSGGIQIFMQLLSAKYLEAGINPQILHRMCAVAAGTLDSLPNAGPHATFFSVCDLTYKEGYPPVCVMTCVIPFLCQIIGIVLASMGVC